MNINGYTLNGELKNANSGFSKWGFAIKDGKEYFIKELINPVYPLDKSVMSEELFRQKREYCLNYEIRAKKFFGLINEASRGNLVRVIDFFRWGSRYYLVSEKVHGIPHSTEYISSLDNEKKLLLLKTVAQCFCDLHSAGVVHTDVKPNNILVNQTQNGKYVAKLIDFDSGFLVDEDLEKKTIGGELRYIAPEIFLRMRGEEVHIDEKIDIFALGLIFHEYFTGRFPYYDEGEYEYPYEVVLNGDKLEVNSKLIPDNLANLISSMLNVNPTERPSAKEVVAILSKCSGIHPEENKPEQKKSGDWFRPAGDL